MDLRILSLNLFFENVATSVRMRAVGEYIRKHRPAIIGFQEVTHDSLQMLRSQGWSKYYDCSLDVAKPFSDAYFVVLFSALPVRSIETLPFSNTGMGRELVVMEVEPEEGQSLIVGTSHLESLPKFKRTRVQQLTESLNFLQNKVKEHEEDESIRTKCLGSFFMGDTNLVDGDLTSLVTNSSSTADIVVERAKSGRAKCRQCANSISQNVLRVGKEEQKVLSNGKQQKITKWFHTECFLRSATSEEANTVFSSPLYKQTHAEEAEEDGVSEDEANLGLPDGWKDLWLSIPGNTEQNGYTFDGKHNGLVRSKKYRSRLDRMYFYPGHDFRQPFRSSSSCILKKLEIIGREEVERGLWMSDHFGLFATCNFSLQNENNTITID